LRAIFGVSPGVFFAIHLPVHVDITSKTYSQ
jgi:hypothetical protein